MTRAPAHLPGSHPLSMAAQPLPQTTSPAQPGAARKAAARAKQLATLFQRAQRTAVATPIARWAAMLGASSLIAACSILPAATPVDTYVLPSTQLPSATPAAAAPHTNSPALLALRIARPVANGVLAGKRIIVMPQADRLQVYQGAVWNEAPPQMLRNRLLDAFMADGRLPTVDTDEGPSAQVDYLLASQLRSFHSVYANGSALPTALVRVDAQLIHTNSNRVVASRSFVVQQPAASKEVPAVVQALGQATDQLAQQMVDWAASHAKHTGNTAAGNAKR